MKKVLIIDDETAVLQNVGEILELEGYDVSIAGDGSEGIQLARTEPPDLVICDIAMPNVDGFGVLQALRSNPETKKIPVIMITGMRDRQIIERIMASGASAFLNKPFTRDALLETIQATL